MKKVLAMFLALAAAAAAQNVPFDRIRRADGEPHNWLTYSGNLQAHRFSALKQIDASNVARLKPAWVYQTNVGQKFETSPIVVDGVMYFTEAPSNVTALDTRTGRVLWKYRRSLPGDLRVCCGQVNRGVALLGDTVYVGTVDSHLVALDAVTGSIRWDVEVSPYASGHSVTAAPLAVKDKIIVGVAGGEYGVRGFLDAYDAKTGKRAWRFWTIPGPGEPGNETWAGDSWKTGAGTTWVTGAYDVEQNLILWGTGNPGPDWNGSVRLGDNLYSDSLIALDADTGKLKWHFQFTPHDVHDWDATEVPVIVDGTFRGQPKKMVLFANRNGFYYVLDRVNGKFLAAKTFVKQTWAKELDDNGRPVRIPGMEPSLKGTLVYPTVGGGTNWWSPSYSPQTKLFYVNAMEGGELFFTGEAVYEPGVQFNAGGHRAAPGVERWGAIRALQPDSGDLAWEFRMHSPSSSGVLSTAGGLVFAGAREGDFFALNAANGKPLWRFPTGGNIAANPVTYMAGDKQQVVIAAGSALFAFAIE